MTHTHAKNHVQRSVGSKEREVTNGRTDITDRITFPANTVDNYYHMKTGYISWG